MRQDIAERSPNLALERPRMDTIHWSYAQAMETAGRHRDAIDHYAQVVTLLNDLMVLHPERRDLADLVLAARAFRGQVHQRAGDFDKARELLEPLLEDIQQVLVGRPANNRLTQALAATRVNLGRIYDAGGYPERAEKELIAALELHERLRAADPENTMMWLRVSVSHHFLGKLYDNTGNTEQALDHYEKMLQANCKIAEREPTSLNFKRQYAVALDMTGFAMRKLGRKLGRNLEALDHHQQANQAFVDLAQSRPDDVDAQRSVAVY